MNWKFIGYVMAGYALVWYILGMLAISLALVQPVDINLLVSAGIFLAPFGAVFGAAHYWDKRDR